MMMRLILDNPEKGVEYMTVIHTFTKLCLAGMAKRSLEEIYNNAEHINNVSGFYIF